MQKINCIELAQSAIAGGGRKTANKKVASSSGPVKTPPVVAR